MIELSVFDRAPRYPLESLTWTPLLVMLAAALALVAAGGPDAGAVTSA
jgi:putative exporter of polyketide antibiotics